MTRHVAALVFVGVPLATLGLTLQSKEPSQSDDRIADAHESHNLNETIANELRVCGLPLSTDSSYDGVQVESVVGELRDAELTWSAPACQSGRTRVAVSANRGARPLLWVHIHTTGGSTMCAIARQNGESVVSPSTTCQWDGKDGVFEFMAGAGASCAERRASFSEGRYTYGQIGRELYNGTICPEFDYGIMLRKPRALAKSVIKERFRTRYKTILKCLKAKNCAPAQPGPSRHWIGDNAWMLMDNFVIRVLLGEEGMNLPLGGVTWDHYDKAVNKLSKFRVVAFLEDLARPATKRMFDRQLGWDIGNFTATVAGRQVRGDPFFTKAEMDILEQRNHFDMKLYSHLRNVSKVQSAIQDVEDMGWSWPRA